MYIPDGSFLFVITTHILKSLPAHCFLSSSYSLSLCYMALFQNFQCHIFIVCTTVSFIWLYTMPQFLFHTENTEVFICSEFLLDGENRPEIKKSNHNISDENQTHDMIMERLTGDEVREKGDLA